MDRDESLIKRGRGRFTDPVVHFLDNVVGRVILDVPNYPLFTIGHTLYILNANRAQGISPDNHWVKKFIWGLVRTFGGQLLKRVLYGQKADILSDSKTFLTYVITWLLFYYSPKDVVHKLYNFKPVKPSYDSLGKAIGSLLEGVYKVRAICNNVEKATSVPEALALGLFSGCGGTLLFDIEKLSASVMSQTNYSNPQWVPKASFYTTLIYYLLRSSSLKFFQGRSGKVAVGFWLILGYFLRSISPELSYPNIFKKVFTRLLGKLK